MEYEKIKRANLIEFLPVKEGDKVLYVDNLKEGLKQNGTYDWIFVLPYEEKEYLDLHRPRYSRLQIILKSFMFKIYTLYHIY